MIRGPFRFRGNEYEARRWKWAASINVCGLYTVRDSGCSNEKVVQLKTHFPSNLMHFFLFFPNRVRIK